MCETESWAAVGLLALASYAMMNGHFGERAARWAEVYGPIFVRFALGRIFG